MRIPACKLWSHEAYGRCVSEDSTGICPAEMPYDFASSDIVVIYRLHAGGLQSFFVSAVCGPYGHRILVQSPHGIHTMTFKTRKCPHGSHYSAYKTRAEPYSAFRGL